MHYYEPNCDRFINQDPIERVELTLYQFAPNTNTWVDWFRLISIGYYIKEAQDKEKRAE